jgi:hypothetical protein
MSWMTDTLRKVIVAICAAVFVLMLSMPVSAEEFIIWYDDDGYPHASKSVEEIPKKFRPYVKKRELGIIFDLDDAVKTEALKSGWQMGQDASGFNRGLGVFQSFGYEQELEEKTAYVMVGTKYSLLKAAAASAASRKSIVTTDFITKTENLDVLSISFYSWGYNPAIILMVQEGRYIKGEHGFPKDYDPQFRVPAYTMSFPYEAVDFTLPAEIQIYNREGKMIHITLNLPEYK